MVRKGTLVFLVIGLAACTQPVDDPANFTAGNSQGNTAASSSSGGGGDTDSATGVAEGSASATSTTGAADSTSSASASASASATDTGPPPCGNGVIDAGEQCDGADLQGFDCASLGLNRGMLACDPVMCTFDTSQCEVDPTSG